MPCTNIGFRGSDEGGSVSLRGLSRASVVSLLLVGGWIALSAPTIWGQEEINRKVRTKVAPIYPDLARHMNITGVVKVVVTVSPNGTVKEAKLVGGHPVLVNAALDAVRKWRFEPDAQESTGVVEFRFNSAR